LEVKDEDEIYIHAARAAEILRIDPRTLNTWARKGKVPFKRTLGGHRRYPESRIRALAKSLDMRARCGLCYKYGHTTQEHNAQ
jgi:predicted site-specific integrase-resolvase